MISVYRRYVVVLAVIFVTGCAGDAWVGPPGASLFPEGDVGIEAEGADVATDLSEEQERLLDGSRVVPSVAGLTPEAASAELEALGLRAGQVVIARTPTGNGRIVAQSPSVGMLVPGGSTVSFTVAVGPERGRVPNLKGITFKEAKRTLDKCGMVVGILRYSRKPEDANRTPGTVLAQSPAAGTPAREGTPVNILLAPGLLEASVPDTTGLEYWQAVVKLREAGLTTGTATRVQSRSVRRGAIVSQDPAAGTKVEPGSPVDLVVSSGAGELLVPDLVGKPRSEAIAAVYAAELKLGRIELTPSAKPSGTIIHQLPEGGKRVAEGTRVTLVISTGRAAERKLVTVPEVAGMAEQEARDALHAVGLAVGVLTRRHSEKAAGIVLRINPVSGSLRPEGSLVTLVVSEGKVESEQAVVPNVVGMLSQQAGAKLQEAGFAVGAVSRMPGARVGLVVSQSPVADEWAAAGSKVHLVVGEGRTVTARVTVHVRPVPQLIGLPRFAALERLRTHGFVTGQITERPGPTPGVILNQEPSPGESVRPGTPVNLVIAVAAPRRREKRPVPPKEKKIPAVLPITRP